MNGILAGGGVGAEIGRERGGEVEAERVTGIEEGTETETEIEIEREGEGGGVGRGVIRMRIGGEEGEEGAVGVGAHRLGGTGDMKGGTTGVRLLRRRRRHERGGQRRTRTEVMMGLEGE